MKLAVFNEEGRAVVLMGGPEAGQALMAERYAGQERFTLRDVDALIDFDNLFDAPSLTEIDARLRGLGIEPAPPVFSEE